MKEKTYYAIVLTSKLKYKNQLRFPTTDSRLLIFWNRTVAKRECQERNSSFIKKDVYTVVPIEI